MKSSLDDWWDDNFPSEWAHLLVAEEQAEDDDPDIEEDEGAQAVDDAGEKNENGKVYAFSNPAFDQLARGWMHTFDMKGDHFGWVTV